MTGTILQGIGSFYTVLCDEDGARHVLRAQKKLRHQKLTPMVGDHVRFIPGEGEENGWLEEILPRHSVIARPAAANVDVLMLVIAPLPEPDLLLIEKLILRARQGNMIPALCVGKTDLGDELVRRIREEYAETGLVLHAVSTVTGEGIDALREWLSGKIVCLAGQSAVGKSSLINALIGLDLETGGLSRKTERGRHTTRKAELLISGSLRVIDTPGFSLLEPPEEIDPQDFAMSFPEYNERMGECRFQPCLHDREPGCAVCEAVRNGDLSAARHERYRQLLAEIRENWKGRYS